MSGRSLLDRLERVLVETYRMRVGRLGAGGFVIGDRAYRRLYGPGAAESIAGAGGREGQGARTLVRETDNGLRASIYFPDAMIRQLERHPPERGIGDRNVDAFATLVEELDHLLCIADRALAARPVSLFELELHANVSKHLVLSRFLAAGRARLDQADRVWLRYHLFEKVRFVDEDAGVRRRYRDAARWAVRFLDALALLEPAARVAALRRFHDEPAAGKIDFARALARG